MSAIDMSALDNFLEHKYDCSSGHVIRTEDGEIIAGCNCGYDAAAAELAAMRRELEYRFVRCTFCDWGYSYPAPEKEQADKDANAHALTCEADPRNRELAALLAFVDAYDAWVSNEGDVWGRKFEDMCVAREALKGADR